MPRGHYDRNVVRHKSVPDLPELAGHCVDKKKAITYLIEKGVFPKPTDVSCPRCGVGRFNWKQFGKTHILYTGKRRDPTLIKILYRGGHTHFI